MPITRRGRGKGKKVDILAGEGTSKSPPDQASQGGADTEIVSRSSSTFPAKSRGGEKNLLNRL